ncbi:4-carboxymuconolactone decarboxylase [Nocardiopsis changdeensis]|uniref:4-carboxymuconolactone decarboxylase n=1 Tax=Nocardiopsis changdeensis TaxID=2831969 RepID=A0ABX8BF77_9ACTN|nr:MULTISPECIES: 4-carboxymuconolactone decarboxylase [Nocardiopsis]QUX20682.1 4-carboxymuconolactone decarboxylase [Nocardiopsis changdeensis]QYX36614.1 4-carboxymuconolactone decarboxylase [Nocardiopsis sp. MT53]
MTIPHITGVELAGGPDRPLLLVGPSLGTSAAALWSAAAERLGDAFHVVGWNLPGHGGAPAADAPFTLAELAAGVLAFARGVTAARGDADRSFCYAGDSVGGAVGLHLLLDSPEAVRSAALLCTGARIGEPEGWRERAATVRASGTPAVVEASAKRWFAPGFAEREPAVVASLLHVLQDADAEGYALVCEALAGFDVRDRLGEVTAPVLAVAGAEDGPTPPASLEALAHGVRRGRVEVLDGVAHLAPAEAPDRVAALLRGHFAGPSAASADPGSPTQEQVRAAGMAVRREVLGDAHVDRAVAATTDFTADFQEFITRYAWGTVWTRPGLDRRSRSMITLTALIARGHHEEFAMHVRAALRNGLSEQEIKEVVLQSAIYCGVPDANSAFRIAQRVLAEG